MGCGCVGCVYREVIIIKQELEILKIDVVNLKENKQFFRNEMCNMMFGGCIWYQF